MTSKVEAFVNHWLYDVEHHLRSRHYELMGDFPLADDKAARDASAEIKLIESWLNPAPKPVAATDKLRRIRAVLEDESIPAEKRVEAIRRLSQSKGLPRGRPRNRDNTRQYAMKALSLRNATGKPLRAITLEVKGCEHPHPKGLSCEKCKEAMRNAIHRLETFLDGIGYKPKFATHEELSSMSEAELDQLWPGVDNSKK